MTYLQSRIIFLHFQESSLPLSQLDSILHVPQESLYTVLKIRLLEMDTDDDRLCHFYHDDDEKQREREFVCEYVCVCL